MSKWNKKLDELANPDSAPQSWREQALKEKQERERKQREALARRRERERKEKRS